jgi:hypothetical protein
MAQCGSEKNDLSRPPVSFATGPQGREVAGRRAPQGEGRSCPINAASAVAFRPASARFIAESSVDPKVVVDEVGPEAD